MMNSDSWTQIAHERVVARDHQRDVDVDMFTSSTGLLDRLRTSILNVPRRGKLVTEQLEHRCSCIKKEAADHDDALRKGKYRHQQQDGFQDAHNIREERHCSC